MRRLTDALFEAIRLLACTALVAVCVHIVTVLAVPRLSVHDAYSIVAGLAPELQLTVLGGADRRAELDPLEDPSVAASVCSFDLADGPVKVALPVSIDGFASIALHQEGGGAFYGLSNAAAVGGRIEIVAVTPAEAADRAAQEDETSAGEVRAVASRRRGFAIFRVLALLPSEREAARAAVGKASCERIE